MLPRTACYLILAIPSQAYFLGAPRPLAQRRAPLVTLCSEALLGGVPAAVDDAILARDEASDAWWRASVRAVRGSQVLVHYSGCDDSWDEWVEASSPNLVRMDETERAQAASAFQSDELEEALEDEELLAKFREQRWEQNARWQLDVFAKAHEGAWTGECVEYDCTTKGGGNPSFAAGAPAPCTSSVAISSAETVTWAETLADAALAINEEFGFDKFRPERGNMAVSNAYTLSAPAEGGGVLLELGLRDARAGRRLRCKLAYAPSGDEMRLARLAVIREAEAGRRRRRRARRAGRAAVRPAARLARGVLLAVPRARAHAPLPGGDRLGQARRHLRRLVRVAMRYQLDRKFDALDGSLRSLELTEIAVDDASVYRRSSRATRTVSPVGESLLMG